jgi:hypothetical protein
MKIRTKEIIGIYLANRELYSKYYLQSHTNSSSFCEKYVLKVIWNIKDNMQLHQIINAVIYMSSKQFTSLREWYLYCTFK